ncbi:MAG: exodeoxyribonuclease V subunit gamma [Candidatus Omnitrophica bacterium]|nr:exodeoxyribonuclease V subunit gamma [Candidatus Omnitrophota bacterium]
MIQNSKPNLILLAGPAGCGKTEACTEAFEEALKWGTVPRDSPQGQFPELRDDLLFILPTAEHRARTIDLILRRGLPGFFQRRITTFDRALREFLKLGGLDYATDVTRLLILKEVFSKLEFNYFKRGLQTSGFLELAGRMIIELKEYLVRPSEFERKLEELKKRFPEFAFKYDDLVHIYKAYDGELRKRNLIDQRDSLELLDAGLSRGEFQAPELKAVWIDGFSDFSKLQLAFIEFLTRHSDQVVITLTLDQDPMRSSLFQIVSETQSALEDMGFVKQWIDGKNHRAQNQALSHLEKNIFKEGRIGQIASSSAIQIFEATGFLGEMEMIAREIKRLVRAHDYHFSDIAVLFRTTDPYLPTLQSVFRKFGIPYEIHERFRLRTSPLASTFSSFLKILLSDWTREDMFNFLKSSYVRRDYELVCELELRALEKGVFRDRTYWLESFPESQVFQEIARFEDEFLKIRSAEVFASWAKKVMSHFGLLDFPDSMGEKIRMDREAARRILLLLDEVRTKTRTWHVTDTKDFIRELLALMEVDLYSVHSRDKNRIQIYNVSLARQKEYKVVFLAGLLEKQFPVQIREDPIFSDLERRTLNEHGEVLKERLPRQALERFLFYMAVTRASEHLILTYPRFNLEGKEALPSFYVDEVRALFKGEIAVKEQPITDILPSWDEVAIREEAENHVVFGLWGRWDHREDRVSLALYNHLITVPRFQSLIQRLLEPIEGMIIDERIKPSFLPKKGMWSPTPIEEYAECPYRYFSNRVLQLESQAEGVDIRRRGTILHDTLEDFFRWKGERKRPPRFEEAVAHALQRLRELWQEEPLQGDRYYKIELERKKMEEWIVQILKVELLEGKPPIAGLIPRYFEYEFRDLVLKGVRRTMVFRGKIDRIDLDPHERFALVIDYKTGKPFQFHSLANGTALQLPLYLIAVREKLGLLPLGGHLYSLATAKSSGFHHRDHLKQAGVSTRKGVSLDEKEFESCLERSVSFAERFVEAIEQIKIPVRPRDCVPYCPYSAVCRIEKWRLEHIYREIEEEDKEKAKTPKV